MPSPSQRYFVRVVIAAVALSLIAVVVRARTRTPKDGGHAASAAPGSARTVAVVVAQAERRDVPVWLEGLGTVAAWQQVTVHPQVDGRLDRVLFTEGQKVHRGQLLAVIDPRPFEAQLAQAEGALARDHAQLVDAKANLVRYQTLVKDKLIAPQQVDDQSALVGQAEGALRADEAAVQTAKLNVGFAHVTSPIDGVVGVRLVDPGNLVRATDQNGLVVITQIDPSALYVTVPEDALPEVTGAMARGTVSVEAWSRDGKIELGKGSLFVIDNQINQATATLRLKCRLPNPDRKLWPNQFVKARLLLETRRGALVVPSAALQRGPSGPFVYLVGEGSRAVQRPVEVALTTDQLAVIGKGLEPGDQVVIEGQDQLRPGAKVQPHALDGSGGRSEALR